MPSLELYDHQSALALDLDRLFQAAAAALPLVLAQPGPHPAVLSDLEEVEVSFIDDVRITQVHAEFMHDPSPTNVITFEHGEILISTDTALRQAAELAHDPQRECALYIIHGLLHLNGHEDGVEAERETMRWVQEQILAQVWPGGEEESNQ